MTMNVSLTPKLKGFVKAKVKTGGDNNANDVAREALRLLGCEDDAVRERKVVRLHKALQTGPDGPDAVDFDIKKVVKGLRSTRARSPMPRLLNASRTIVDGTGVLR